MAKNGNQKLAVDTLGALWATADWDTDPAWDFNSAANDTPEQPYALWNSTVERSRVRLNAALAGGVLDQVVHLSGPDGRHLSLRRLLCDLIEEYGRHTRKFLRWMAPKCNRPRLSS
jgi:hypothetical protein